MDERATLNTVLVLLIGLLVPWIVHLAPPRHRPLALIAGIGVVLLYTLLQQNAFLGWELWAGLAVGIVSVALLAPGRSERGSGGGGGRASRRDPSPWDDDAEVAGDF